MAKWAVGKGLLEKGQCWYQLKWEQGRVIENDKVKLCWDFKYLMKKETTARRPDVTIEYKDRKLIQIMDQNINQVVNEKLQKYQQLGSDQIASNLKIGAYI